MHANVNVKLHVGKEEHNIPHTAVTQQGNNMALILFLRNFLKLLKTNGKKSGD
jgi:hypothetical protein